jgi:hypothetical protein
MRIGFWTITSAFLAVTTLPAHATLTISKKATKNVVCSNGVCSATKTKSNLNAGDLSSMLASEDVKISSGTGAMDIEVDDGVSWASAHRLTLDSDRSLTVNGTISIQGTGGLTLTIDDGGVDGTLSFPKGRATFLDMASSFVVNGVTYTLVSDVTDLAAAVQSSPSVNVALANDYNAKVDGTYTEPPVPTFSGRFEGAGNTLSGLEVAARNAPQAGLFTQVQGTVSDFHLKGSVRTNTYSVVGGIAGLLQGGTIVNSDFSGHVSSRGSGSTIGGLVGISQGTIKNSHSSGRMFGVGTVLNFVYVGGLAGFSSGFISNSFSTAKINGGIGANVGGIVGNSSGSISSSYANGNVIADDNGVAGGLVGFNLGSVQNCYANGFVNGGVNSTVGGLLGFNQASVNDSYSSGPVSSGSGNAVGGFIGNDVGSNDLTDTYFDIDTSGQSHGVGNNTGYPGVTGLTTAQFQAGLPDGFDPAVWEENPDINGGLPYLIVMSSK